MAVHFAVKVTSDVGVNGKSTFVSPLYHPSSSYPFFSDVGADVMLLPFSTEIASTALPPADSNVIV